MTNYFTSDLHFGHELVARHRGFTSTAAHDLHIWDVWAGTITKNDIVWVLGDLTLKRPEEALGLLGSLPGRKRLILGNHDRAHPAHRDAPKWQAKYFPTFEYVATSACIRINGMEVLLSHFPYDRDRGEEARYPQWRLPDLGLPLLHGHTHGREMCTNTPIYSDYEPTRYRTEVHVGWDAWGRPASEQAIALLLGATQ